jgi:predicted XRE-type DNA-binding protein
MSKRTKDSLVAGHEIEITPSSGNVFADLGLPNPEEELAKVKLAIAIKRTMEAKGLSQTAAAKLMGESQPNVSLIVKGRLEKFSSERLMRHLTALGKDLELIIKDAPPGRTRGLLYVSGVA